MADEVKVQDAMQSDFSVVVNDIAEELLTRLNMDEDGSIIDMFQTGSFDPWQLFVFFGALEKINARRPLSFMPNLKLLSALAA